MVAQRRVAQLHRHLGSSARAAPATSSAAAQQHGRSAVDNPQDRPHPLILARFNDYLRGEPSYTNADPIITHPCSFTVLA